MAKELRADIVKMHKDADLKLNLASSKYLNKGIKLACEKIALEIGCSDITVRNYAHGKGRDGFLKIVIAKEFKKLKL